MMPKQQRLYGTSRESDTDLGFVFYLIMVALAVFFIIADIETATKLIALGFIFLSIAFVSLSYPAKSAPGLDRIAQTYARRIEPQRTYPEYRIVPEGDKHATIRFGCAPLVDCAIPLLLRELDRQTWNSLSMSYALDVDLSVTSFNNLFSAVVGKDSAVDVVVASAAAVDRAATALPNKTDRTSDVPVCLLPILQQFNAYFLFARRQALVDYLNSEKHPDIDLVSQVNATNSVDRVLSLGFQQADKKGNGQSRRTAILAEVLKKADIFVERHADLDAAVVAYWEALTKDSGSVKTGAATLHFDSADGHSIAETFFGFLRSSGLALYIGGLAQTAYLLTHSNADGEFIVIARPEDINYANVNSFVCSRDFANSRGDDLLRLYAWWFDVVNRFRRNFLFEETGRQRLTKLLRQPIQISDSAHSGTIALMPPGADEGAVATILEFLKVRDPTAIGSFLLPNMYEAAAADSKLLTKLRKNDAVREFFAKQGSEDTAVGSGSSKEPDRPNVET